MGDTRRALSGGGEGVPGWGRGCPRRRETCCFSKAPCSPVPSQPAGGRRRLLTPGLSPRLRRRLRADPAPCPHAGVHRAQRSPPGAATSLSDPLARPLSQHRLRPRLSPVSLSQFCPVQHFYLLGRLANLPISGLSLQGDPAPPTFGSLSIYSWVYEHPAQDCSVITRGGTKEVIMET